MITIETERLVLIAGRRTVEDRDDPLGTETNAQHTGRIEEVSPPRTKPRMGRSLVTYLQSFLLYLFGRE